MAVGQAGVVLDHEDLQFEELAEEVEVLDLLWLGRRDGPYIRRVWEVSGSGSSISGREVRIKGYRASTQMFSNAHLDL